MDKMVVPLAIVLCAMFLTYNSVAASGPYTVTIRSSPDVKKESKYISILGATADNKNITIDINSDFSFFVFQVHSFMSNIHLSSSAAFDPDYSTYGTDIGLVQFKSNATYEFYFKHYYDMDDILFFVTLYNKNAPVPGGCLTESFPDLKLDYSYNFITVTVQEAMVKQEVCKVDDVKLEIYRMLLTPSDFSIDSYFVAIKNMSTVEDIKTYGTKVSQSSNASDLSWYFSNYRGIGSVYAVVATFGNHQSAYVPALTYGCDIKNGSCYQFFINSFSWYLMGSSILLTGLISTNTDHTHVFKYNCFVFAIQVMIVLYYIVPFIVLLFLSCLMSRFVDIFPLVHPSSIYLTNIIFASYFTTCCVLFNSQIGDISYIQNHYIYWITFLALWAIIFFILKLTGLTYLIIAFLYISIGLSTLYRGILYYAIINNIRHMIDSEFAFALVEPPFILADVITIGVVAIILFSPLLVLFLANLCKGFATQERFEVWRLLQKSIGNRNGGDDGMDGDSMIWMKIIIRQWKNIRSDYDLILN